EDGIEGLVHISELAQRHVEVPEQVAKVGDELFVKVIDIDLERRRISLSLKQANEGVEPDSEDFDPSLYGMATDYDEQGNYKYPEGFDPETNEWLEGFEAQREAWEAEYAAAHARWEAHKAQIAASREAEAAGEVEVPEAAGAEEDVTASYSSNAPAEEAAGTLASDEALAALREKLTGN
ncbi:MAG: S1 RNA-binding domain-containing protein, partial [Actinomycetaceae bacterium]